MTENYTKNDHVRLKTGGPDMLVERIFHDGWIVCRWQVQGEAKASAFEATKLEPITNEPATFSS